MIKYRAQPIWEIDIVPRIVSVIYKEESFENIPWVWSHPIGNLSGRWQSFAVASPPGHALTCDHVWTCIWVRAHCHGTVDIFRWTNMGLTKHCLDHICAGMNWRKHGVWRSINRSLSCPAPCVHVRTHLGVTSLHDIEQCCNRVNQKGPFWNLLFHAQINCKLRAMTASFIKPPRKSQSKVRRALNCKARQMTSSLFLILLGTYWALAAMLKMCGQTSICKETNK